MLAYRIEGRIIIINLSGKYPVHLLLETMRKALDDPAATLPARLLLDASLSESIRSTEEIEEISETISTWKPEIDRIAIYVKSDLLYGVSRMAAAFSSFSPFDVAPFRSLEEALVFLSGD